MPVAVPRLKARIRAGASRPAVVACLALLTAAAAVAADPSPPATPQTVTRLLVDWEHIDKGRLEATLDPERISDQGRAIIERNKKMFGIHPDLSGHGMKRSRLPFGVRIAAEPPRKTAPWLVEDKPWEASLGWVTVLRDEGKYRCWYSVSFPKPLGAENPQTTFFEGRQMDTGKMGLCYAESDDGATWRKPSLGLFSFAGSKDNNIVSIWQMSETAVFRDPSAAPEARYKAFVWEKLSPDPNRPDYGLFGAVSPDGLRWSRLPEPVLREFCDTQNVVLWDGEKYAGYFRGGAGGGRAIRYAETTDFSRWPSPQVIAAAGPLDHPADDFYNNGFTRHPDDSRLGFIFCSVFHRNTDLLDVRLGIVRNPRVINWVSYEPIIPVGRPGAWDCGGVYVGPNMVRLPDGTLAVPYHGLDYTHGEYRSQFYADHRDGTSGFAWAVWDDARIAGISAADHGEFWTRGEVTGGGPLEINARTSKVGSVEVEVWHKLTGFVSEPIPGFSFAEFEPIRGDEPWQRLRWKGKDTLAELAGKSIQLRFRLSDATVFAYRYAK